MNRDIEDKNKRRNRKQARGKREWDGSKEYRESGTNRSGREADREMGRQGGKGSVEKTSGESRKACGEKGRKESHLGREGEKKREQGTKKGKERNGK